MSQTSLIIQADLLDEEYFDLIDLIDSYPVSTNFAHWLSGGDYSQDLISQNYVGHKYLRVTQYKIHEDVIFTGKHEFYLNKLSKDFIKKATNRVVDLPMEYLAKIGFRKEKIARIAAETYYTVISRCYVKEELVALSWEIYELATILKIYKEKKTPLEYWMSERRE
jgi:hypothetical protein